MMRYGLTGLLLGTALAVQPASAAEPTPDAPALIEMTDDGPVLLTPAGMALYTYGADDSTPGKSACTEVPVKEMKDPTSGLGKYPLPGHKSARSCIEVWPPYLAGSDVRPAYPFDTISRPEGKQWTYLGKPLYTSIKDSKPGDRNASLTGSFGRRGWRLAAPPLDFPPGLQFTRIGNELVLASANGRPVYTPANGRLQRSCAGCGDPFKPVSAASIVEVSGDWSVVEANPGVKQFAYKGMPLFAAPDAMSNAELDADRNWKRVTLRKLAPLPAQIGTRFSLLGDIFTTRRGMTLYMFTCAGLGSFGCDDPGGPAAAWSALCGDAKECSRRWRPYLAEPNARPSGEWSIAKVPDPIFADPAGETYLSELPRVNAWAYRGRPVYTYYEDEEPGDVWGNQIRWFGLSAFQAVQVPGRSLSE